VEAVFAEALLASGFEALVADGSLCGVEVCRGDGLGDAVGCHHHGPLALVDQVVVVAAEQAPVGQVGGSAGVPGPQMVRFGPGWWAVAAREDAPLVAVGEGDALVSVEQPSGAAVRCSDN